MGTATAGNGTTRQRTSGQIAKALEHATARRDAANADVARLKAEYKEAKDREKIAKSAAKG
jgi:hypothetical protein